jgi:hypothetical protein
LKGFVSFFFMANKLTSVSRLVFSVIFSFNEVLKFINVKVMLKFFLKKSKYMINNLPMTEPNHSYHAHPFRNCNELKILIINNLTS